MSIDQNASSPKKADKKKPIVLIKLGRGRLGGSALLQVLSERAINAGRSVIMGDADRNNEGLSISPYYKTHGLKRPVATDKLTMEEWLNEALTQSLEQEKSLLLDIGGGDQLIKDYAVNIDLIAAGKELGLEIVGLFMCGSADGDFDFIKKIWEEVGFHPAKSILVFNEYTVPEGIPPGKMHEKIITAERCDFFENKTELFTINMPNLRYMNDILASGLTFKQAQEGATYNNGKKFNPMAAFVIKKFFNDLETSISEAKADRYLP